MKTKYLQYQPLKKNNPIELLNLLFITFPKPKNAKEKVKEMIDNKNYNDKNEKLKNAWTT